MGRTWMIIEAKKTKREGFTFEGIKITKSEDCKLCSNNKSKLYGFYGTWNEFGSFNGICEDCLEQILELKEEEK